MKYSIFEENLERLEKKLIRIQNKCKKYGADFHYEVVGEEFRDLGSEEEGPKMARFVIVDVEGFAKVNGWEFVATIDHHENRNVIRNIIDLDIPEKYWTCRPGCDHCKTARPRKDTYLIHNVETGEFKQVGTSCLRDFTGGYDAELAAAYMSMYDMLIEGESTEGYSFGSYTPYYEIDDILKMSKSIISKMGYASSTSETATPTKIVIWDLMDILRKGYTTKATQYVEAAGVPEYYKKFQDMDYLDRVKKYYLESEDTSSYTQNLKTIFSSEYCKSRDFGYIVSSVFCYDREMKKREQKAAAEAKRVRESEVSQYQGEVGQKITFTVKEFKCVSAYEGMYGEMSYLFKFVDNDGNVYMWSTSKDINEELGIDCITGTVKKHEEYRGLKQTWVTRCKVTFGKREAPKPAGPDVIEILKEMDSTVV